MMGAGKKYENSGTKMVATKQVAVKRTRDQAVTDRFSHITRQLKLIQFPTNPTTTIVAAATTRLSILRRPCSPLHRRMLL
jgi:hypothetical protein